MRPEWRPPGNRNLTRETGFGLVNPSLRIFRLATLIGSGSRSLCRHGRLTPNGQTRHQTTDGPTGNRTERRLTQPEGRSIPNLQSRTPRKRSRGGESKASCQTPKNVADKRPKTPGSPLVLRVSSQTTTGSPRQIKSPQHHRENPSSIRFS